MSQRVTPGGHPLCYYVESSRATHPAHQVNLGAHQGGGSCTCENFVYRMADVSEHRAPGAPAPRCSHILAAREFLVDETIIRLLRQPPPR